MSDREPLRLREDPSVARALRVDLARAAARPLVVYDVAAGLSRFEHARGLGASPGGSGAGASSVAGASGGTVLGAALKGALLGMLTMGTATLVEPRAPVSSSGPGSVAPASSVAPAAALRPPSPETSARPSPTSPIDTAKPPGPQQAGRDGGAAPMAPAAVLSYAAPVPAATSDETHAPVVAEVPAPAAPAARGDALAAEMEHLVRLRALEERDPAQALALAAEGNQRFPAGLFTQEREAIAIGALVRLGRGAEARARAAVFVAAYPRSAFIERIKKLSGIDASR